MHPCCNKTNKKNSNYSYSSMKNFKIVWKHRCIKMKIQPYDLTPLCTNSNSQTCQISVIGFPFYCKLGIFKASPILNTSHSWSDLGTSAVARVIEQRCFNSVSDKLFLTFLDSTTFGGRVQKCHFGNFSSVPKWHFWTHAWFFFWPKAFYWSNMKMAIRKNIHNMSQGPPDPGFM
jgi:hypothetical protein